MLTAPASTMPTSGPHSARHGLRSLLIGTIGFLTLVDLFAAQAILPSLVRVYGVTPAAMGFAVNASTLGMAAACLGVALISRRLDRHTGIWVSLAALAVPTALLAIAPDLVAFTLLRIAQGVFMATAFTLTMSYLADTYDAEGTAAALAAYVTGVVASNLVGRLVAGSVADLFGLTAGFMLFAALNLAGALLVVLMLERMSAMAMPPSATSPLVAWSAHLRDPALRAAFAVGFLILFAFIGTFTYVNFVLTGPRLGLGQMSLGLVYLVFLPSLLTTPLAGHGAARLGAAPAASLGLAVALAGLPLLLLPHPGIVLTGMVLVGIGTFFAQAVATGFVGRAAMRERTAASGLYLAAYYLGGLAGAAVLGQVFDRLGWAGCVAGVGLALLLALLMAQRLTLRGPQSASA